MTDTVDLSTFRAKVAARQAQKEAERKAALASSHDDDLVPDAASAGRTEEDLEMDRIVEKIDILDAYNKWCGKSTPAPRAGQVEGIKVSCPIPTHPDKDPSAWINLDKQTWYCGGCQIGGDAHDLAAYHFGYPVPGYKDGAQFHELRRDMAKSYGYTFHKLMDGKTYAVAPQETDNQNSEPVTGSDAKTTPPTTLGEQPTTDAKVVEIYSDDDGDLEQIVFPALDWRSVVTVDTFLDIYMRQTTVDDVAEEFHFWNGLIALGMALGRQVRLYDTVPVYGNLFVCTLGHSGSGKSKARYHLDRLLNEALPYKQDDPFSVGTKKVSTPASAEVLVHSFDKPIYDPSDPKKLVMRAPVRGLIDFNELSALIGRTNRTGNVLKPTLMQFYDMETTVATSSMATGEKKAQEPFASCLTTTQPKALRDLLGRQDDASGFLNRWVFAAGPEKQRWAVGGVAVDISPAVKPLQDIAGWSASFTGSAMIQWSDAAIKVFSDFFHRVIEPDKKRAVTELIVRIDLLLKKLILLFAANEKLKEVTEDIVERVLRMYPYITACYSLPEAQIGNTLQTEIREAIAYQAQKPGYSRGVSLSELSRSFRRRKYPMDLVKKTVELMVAFGELEMTVTKGVGRPTERFQYVG